MATIPDNKNKFGTAPVFFTAISTILGAIMFLRFGFAVGNVGFLGTIAIILIGHAVTIPTALAIGEIATNQKVEGGGEYYIMSRSFGLVIGSSIGIALYLSQAISVAFYIIAFAESFSTLIEYLRSHFQLSPTVAWLLEHKQTISIPALLLLMGIVLTKGADLGVKALYIVVVTLFISLAAFFIGQTTYSNTHSFDPLVHVGNYRTRTMTDTDTGLIDNPNQVELNQMKESIPEENMPMSVPVGFFTVFAIIFPAFTGMTAGVGLSGDLRNPSKSIPLGTLAATVTGMIIYIFIAYKLAISAPPTDLVNTDHIIMADIAWQGSWLIPIGLAAATVSSALGSIMVAPRTLQAIARDQLLPSENANKWLSKGKGKNDEPFNSTVVTVIIAFFFVMMGGLDAVAGIISMFFMVTYGSLNLISFLNHFAADPSYRPKFKSRWYISLFGALACFGLMFMMNVAYAVFAIIVMIVFYLILAKYNSDKKNLALIFQGVIFQISRKIQIFMQKTEKESTLSWRPAVVCISEHSFERFAAFDLLRWLSQRYGFGTYIHFIPGFLSKSTNTEAKRALKRLIKMAETTKSNVYIDTLVSPSFTSAIAQVIQLPGFSGKENNLLLLEFSKQNPDNLLDIIDNYKLIKSVDFDVMLLGSSERGFGLRHEIHIWIKQSDYNNATLMILIGYVIMGHKDWENSSIKIFAIVPQATIREEKEKLFTLIDTGQLPISKSNIEFLIQKETTDIKASICEKSKDADVTIMGMRYERIKHLKEDYFSGYDKIGNIIFIEAGHKKEIK